MALTDPSTISVANLPPEDVTTPTPKPVENPYDHGDTDFDQELDALQEPAASVAAAAPKSADPPAKVKPPTPKHPRGLVNRALRYGATQAQIDAATTDELDEWVERTDAQREREREAAFRERDVRTAASPKAAEKPAETEPDDDALLGELTKELGLDPRMEKILKRASEDRKELKQIKARLEQQESREGARQVSQAEEAVDRAIASLGANYEKVFGKGNAAELDPKSAEMLRRCDLLRAAGVDLRGDAPSIITRKITPVAERLFGHLFTAAESEAEEPTNAYEEAPKLGSKTNGKPRISQEQWDDAGLAKPTQRHKKEAKSPERATRAVAAKMKELGVTDADFDALEEDGLPE